MWEQLWSFHCRPVNSSHGLLTKPELITSDCYLSPSVTHPALPLPRSEDGPGADPHTAPAERLHASRSCGSGGCLVQNCLGSFKRVVIGFVRGCSSADTHRWSLTRTYGQPYRYWLSWPETERTSKHRSRRLWPTLDFQKHVKHNQLCFPVDLGDLIRSAQDKTATKYCELIFQNCTLTKYQLLHS